MLFAFIFVMAGVPLAPMGRSVQAVSAPDSGSKAGDSLVLRHVAPVSLYD